MDDQFDNELRDHIREVFDKFEDPSADEGWLLLREKFPARQVKRRTIGWLWWSAAAIALLFLSVALWKYTAQVGPNKLVAKKEVTTPNKNMAATKTGGNNIAAAKPSKSTSIIKSVPANHITSARLNPAKLSVNKTGNSFAAKHPANAPLNKPDVIVSTVDIMKPKTPQNTVAANTVQPVNSPVLPNANPPQKLIAAVKTDNGNPAANQPPANQSAVNATTATVKPVIRPKSIDNMLANNTGPRQKLANDLGPRVRFGVFAGTYVNYSKGSGNQRNVGGGFTSAIRITKNLKLVTGVGITQNSLSFNSSLPFGPQPGSLSAPGVALGVAAASAYNAKSAVTVATMPAFKNYGANMVGLDIPLNLQYDFNPKKNNLYALAGLSSGTFINETYTYKYNYPALASASLQQIQNETSHKTFDSFYFGKTLNFAVGIATPIGGHRIILEPFVKYPLDGIGAQNLRFGSGGINLKFNFATGRR